MEKMIIRLLMVYARPVRKNWRKIYTVLRKGEREDIKRLDK